MKNSPLQILSNIAHMSVEDWYNHLAKLARLVDGLGPVLGLVLLPAAAPAPGQQLAAHGDLGPDLEFDSQNVIITPPSQILMPDHKL